MTIAQERYTSGEYLKENPLWHTDEAPWKARDVLRLLARNKIVPTTICDVGCGSGEVLKLVQEAVGPRCTCWGYDMSPQALALCQLRANERLHFKLADVRHPPAEAGMHFDLILLMDVLEHLEDYFGLLRDLRPHGEFKIIHIPLDISVRNILSGNLIKFRARYGHLHYFTKALALQMLQDVGYEIIDYLYTWQSNSLGFIWKEYRANPPRLARKLGGFVAREILGLPTRLLFAMHHDLAAAVLGRWRLLVLAR